MKYIWSRSSANFIDVHLYEKRLFMYKCYEKLTVSK